MSRISIYIKVLITAILIVLLVRTFAFTSCTIPSTGMENSLYQGERILVNKWSYGLRLPFSSVRLFSQEVGRDDIVLFNNPSPADRETPIFARELYISRCVGLPGDTLMLNRDLIVTDERSASPDSKQLYAYPYEQEDSLKNVLEQLGIRDNLLVGYKEGRYVRSFSHYEVYLLRQKLGGAWPLQPLNEADSTELRPLVVPARGKAVEVAPWNITLLCNTILRHENRKAVVKNDTLWVDGRPVSSYVFRKDYYWMVSNNPVNLSDSRLFGLVPHDHLIGKACRIWYSSRKGRTFQQIQ